MYKKIRVQHRGATHFPPSAMTGFKIKQLQSLNVCLPLPYQNATDYYDQLEYITVKKQNANTYDYLKNIRTRSYFF